MRLICTLILFGLVIPLPAQIEGKVPGFGTKLDCIVIKEFRRRNEDEEVSVSHTLSNFELHEFRLRYYNRCKEKLAVHVATWRYENDLDDEERPGWRMGWHPVEPEEENRAYYLIAEEHPEHPVRICVATYTLRDLTTYKEHRRTMRKCRAWFQELKKSVSK